MQIDIKFYLIAIKYSCEILHRYFISLTEKRHTTMFLQIKIYFRGEEVAH